MWLTIQTLIVHTALAMARNADELSGTLNPSSLTLALAAASRSAPYAPIMCLLFLANRMRVLALTQGKGEPMIFVKVCEVVACAGMTGQLLLTLIRGYLEQNREHIEKLAARYKWLAAVQFIDAVPKSASGKILRKNLRKMEEEAGGKVFA
jgi:acyl-CoA synthetase (AMP-forming)/AMP-acid ligase II